MYLCINNLQHENGAAADASADWSTGDEPGFEPLFHRFSGKIHDLLLRATVSLSKTAARPRPLCGSGKSAFGPPKYLIIDTV
jgi:hypothetical protein